MYILIHIAIIAIYNAVDILKQCLHCIPITIEFV